MFKSLLSNFSFRLHEFVPKSVVCLREGYTGKKFFSDLFAGLSVGVIAIPLSLAFAIASGVAPERGLYTAIIGGFLISLLGGSRIQIGGPAGAFVITVLGVIEKFGYEGLACATLLAAFLMVLMGIFRAGILLRFVPYPVTMGFTSGMAVVIFSSQIKDFCGLTAELPSRFIEKWITYFHAIPTANLYACGLAVVVLTILFFFKIYLPKWPGGVLAIVFTTLFAGFFALPVETIESKFGQLPRSLPIPHLPVFSFDLVVAVFPSALTIAFLGAIESLLSAMVSDGMTGNRHKSNCELVAQGFANIGSILFGGICVTGVIARTSANIKLGGKTPVSGMVHALVVLLFMLFLAPVASKIPLATLAAILIFVAWNMCELPHFIEILKGPKGDAAVMLATFLLTILVDLSVAVQIGVVLSAIIFLKKMTDKTTVALTTILKKENQNESNETQVFQKELPTDVTVFEITGPFFYSVANLLDEALYKLNFKPRVFILNLEKTPLIDATALRAIKQFSKKCVEKKILFLIAGASNELLRIFKRASLTENFFHNVDSALIFARASQQILPVHPQDKPLSAEYAS